VIHHAVFGHFLVFAAGLAVIAVGIDAQTSTWEELAPDFDVFRVHQFDEILHDDVDTIFVKTSVIAEAEKIQLQTLAFHHFFLRHVADVNGCKIGLTRDGAEAGEFRTVEFDHVVVVRMLVVEAFQYFGIVVERVVRIISQAL